MREVIEEILGTERQAQRTVEDARKKAAEIQARSEAESARILAEARLEAQRILREQADEARAASRARHQETIAKAEEENAAFLKRQEAALGRPRDQVVRILVSTEAMGPAAGGGKRGPGRPSETGG